MLELKNKTDGNTYYIGLVVTSDGVMNDRIVIMKNSGAYNRYKVVNDGEYTYNIQRTQIKAENGAYGLYEHFAHCYAERFALDSWCFKVLENICQNVKPMEV